MTELVHRWTPRRAAGLALAAVAVAALTLAGGRIAADSAATARPAGSTESCGWVDAAAVAELPLADAMVRLGELTSFGAAIGAAGFDTDLEGQVPFTVFAPSNAAIDAIPQNVFDSLLADAELLARFVGYHIVPGQQLSAAELVAAGTVETLSGPVTIEADGDLLVVNGEASVTCADVTTADATLLVIDRFLQPPSESPGCPPDATSVPGSSVPGSSVPGSSVPGSSVPAGDPCPDRRSPIR